MARSCSLLLLSVVLTGCGSDLALDEGHALLDYRDPSGAPCVPALPAANGLAQRPDLRACFTLQGERLGQDTASVIGEVHFSLTRWIPKEPQSDQYIGFTLTTDGDIAYVIESGEERFRGSTAGWLEPSAMIGASTDAISLVAVCPVIHTPAPDVDVEDDGALEWQTRTTTSSEETPSAPVAETMCDAAGCCGASSEA